MQPDHFGAFTFVKMAAHGVTDVGTQLVLPLAYLPIGAVVLWLLGQLAVLGPALRTAAVPPVVATRSVWRPCTLAHDGG